MNTRKRTAKPNKKTKPRESYSEEAFLRWSNQQRLDFFQNQYDRLTEKDGKIRQAVGATDTDIASILASANLFRRYVHAEKHWARWSVQEKLDHQRSLRDFMLQERAKLGDEAGISDADIAYVGRFVALLEHQVDGQNNWSKFSLEDSLVWLRQTYAMLTADDGRLARETQTPREYIDEIELRLAITQTRVDGAVDFEDWSTAKQVENLKHLYRLYTKNGGLGARLFGITPTQLDELRASPAKLAAKAQSAQILKSKIEHAADALLETIDKVGRKSSTITREDMLGKKGH